METFCSMEVELAWMELLNEAVQDSCCSRRGALAELGNQDQRKAVRAEDTGHLSKLCVKTLFTSENFHSDLIS